jgi:hypothetical protein
MKETFFCGCKLHFAILLFWMGQWRPIRSMVRGVKTCLVIVCSLVLCSGAGSQQRSAAPPPSAAKPGAEDFARATDEVLADMAKLLGLPQLEPLKKSLRSRDEIRAYVIREEKAENTPERRYADQKELEKLGLIPKGFELESFLVDLLTEQIAGLYDPKAKEFYVADWIDPNDQREVMAHELTHALQDQHYHLDKWRDAAKPNEDAELARDAVVEGSAVASMIDYELRQAGSSLDALAGLSISDQLGAMEDTPELKKAPPFIRDLLLFPYGSGADFSQRVLHSHGGWPAFHTVFENPPVSTQQILHPDLYFHDVAPQNVEIPDVPGLSQDWKRLDTNVLGEFGLREVLKQFLDTPRAIQLAANWQGDRYALYENIRDRRLLLAVAMRVGNPEHASQLLEGFNKAFEKKYVARTNVKRSDNSFSFDTQDGGVFFRCSGNDCVSFEGADQQVFDKFVRALGWRSDAASVHARRQRTTPVVAALH